jgi:cytochrome c biogenesis protein
MFRLLTKRLASLRLTLVIIAAFGLGIVLSYVGWLDGTWALAVPLALFAVNLFAALVANPGFRRQGGLLVFHLGLIAIVLLVALGRLTYLKGQAELAEGEEFGGALSQVDAGPWHRSGLSRVHFTNGGFSIAYAPGVQRGATRNIVLVPGEDGSERQAEIGDQKPLVLHGYRFYTSPNKGFAPAFVWYPASGGPPMLGTVHLPSYPIHKYEQSREWQLPGSGRKVWTMLQFDEVILDPAQSSTFRLPNRYKVVVRIGDRRHEFMQAGESLDLPEGRLVFDGLRTWMGYVVFYDWTLHWLLISCMVAVAGLGWHYWSKFAARPWNP